MLKISKLMLMGALWFGACVQAAEAVPTKQENGKLESLGSPHESRLVRVSSVSQDDVDFVLQAYKKYQQSMEKRGADDRQIAIDYCNELLSRFYRSQLDAMAKAAPSNFNILKEAIRVACEKIDEIGAALIDEIGAALIEIVEAGDIHKVQQEINKLRTSNTLQIVLNAVDQDGRTALIRACEWGYADIVEVLLNLKKPGTDELLVDVNAVDQDGRTELMWACWRGYAGIVKELLSIKDASGKLLVDVNAVDQEGYTALMGACINGSESIVKELLSLKDPSGKLLVNVNAARRYGDTVLICACRKGNAGIVKELLSLKDASGKLLVDVNAVNFSGETALMIACVFGNVGMVKDLLSIKDASGKVLVDVNAVDQDGRTALMGACREGKVGIVKELLEHGANILSINQQGQSALRTLHEKLMDRSVSAADKATIRSILKVFDALRPDLDAREISKTAEELERAYVMMQQGNSDPLFSMLVRNEILGYYNLSFTQGQASSLYHNAIASNVKAMQEIFKPASIAPILKFLRSKCLNQQERLILDNYPQVIQEQHAAKAKAMPRARADMVTNMSW